MLMNEIVEHNQMGIEKEYCFVRGLGFTDRFLRVGILCEAMMSGQYKLSYRLTRLDRLLVRMIFRELFGWAAIRLAIIGSAVYFIGRDVFSWWGKSSLEVSTVHIAE